MTHREGIDFRILKAGAKIDKSKNLVFAYLFEKFPSFSQTFCAREVAGLLRAGLDFPVYSIRHSQDEPDQDELVSVPVTYLPEEFCDILKSDSSFRRAARSAQSLQRKLWNDDKEKRRIYEALWLGPRLRERGVEHVHTHFVGTAARTAFWLHRIFGIRFSVTAHANDIFRDETHERLAQIFDVAAVVVTVSDFSVRFLRSHYPEQKEKFVRVYNGIDVGRFATRATTGARPLIMSVGRYIEKKGFGDLIRACAELGERDFECRIVGHGPLEEELRALAQELGVGDRVELTGPKTEREIREMLAHCYVFVLPCLTADDGSADNLPTVIMEAMAAGVPVVSTAVAGVPEMVEDGRTGFVVEEKNPKAVAEKVVCLLDDPERRGTMGLAGRERCLELFDSQRTVEALIDVFRSHGAIAD